LLERAARFINELRRRKVVRAAGGYLVGSFVALQVVDASFQLIFADPDSAGRIVLIVLIAGFPIAMMVSWMFDVRPPRFQREHPTPEGGSPRRPAAPRTDTVAVLPLTNLSDDPENLYFSEGITDDIVSSIGHIDGLRVLSRRSVSGRDVENEDVRTIAMELGVGTVVLGSVRRAADRVRIVAEVVDGASGDQLWSATFDRELRDIFAIQSDVAKHVAEAVRHGLSSDERRKIEARGTTNVEAYDLYLRARHLWSQRTERATSEAIRYLERALERDPRFALAHTAMAEAKTVLGLYGAREPGQILAEASTSVEAALAIDASLGEALFVRACLLGIYEWRWPEAESTYGHAVRAAPSYATGRQWYAMNLLTPLARFEDARGEIEHARVLDPESAAIQSCPGIVSFYAREYDRAVEELEAVVGRQPEFPLTHLFLGQAGEQLGRHDDAIHALSRAAELSGESSEALAALAHAFASAGREAESEALLRRLEQRRVRRYVSGALLAQVEVALSRPDEAIARLEEAAEARATDLIWLGTRPTYDPLRGIDRFEAILGRVRL
jgi:serine/threonine-protein kinase